MYEVYINQNLIIRAILYKMSSLSSSYQSLFNEYTGVFSNAAIKDLSNTLIACDVDGNVIAATAIAPLTYTAGTAQLSLGYNTSNLKITSTLLNTIQDITTSSTPEFAALKLTTGAGAGKYLQSDASGNTSWQTLASTVSSLQGTANQVLVNGTSGSPQTGIITLTLPQSIDSGSSPTFASLTLTSPLTGINGGTGVNNSTRTITTSTGSAGRLLASDASGNASYSTATYPLTAGTINTILRSDGTNWVNSSGMTVDAAGAVSTSSTLAVGGAVALTKFFITGGAMGICNNFSNATARPAVGTSRIAGEISAIGGATGSLGADDGFLRLSAGAGTTASTKAYIDLSGYSTVGDMNTNIVFGTGTTQHMRINSSGNVGIGTASPGQKLEIGGTSSQIYLNSATSNMIQFNTNGVAPPTFTTSRSLGTKLILYPNFSNGTSADYALGIDGNTMWFGLPVTSSTAFKWYGGITEWMRLNNTGLTIGSTTTTGMFNVGTAAQFQINSSGVVTSGSWNGSVIPMAYGGTNANLTAAVGSIVYSSSTAMALLAPPASNNCILLGQTATNPIWSTATYPSVVSTGDLLYASANNVISRLPIGSNTFILTSNGTNMSWQAPAAGGVATVAGTANQITSSGTTAITLALANPLTTPGAATITGSLTASNIINQTASITIAAGVGVGNNQTATWNMGLSTDNRCNYILPVYQYGGPGPTVGINTVDNMHLGMTFLGNGSGDPATIAVANTLHVKTPGPNVANITVNNRNSLLCDNVSGNAAFTVSGAGNIVPGAAGLSTSATDGFIYLQTCPGAPLGTPTTYTGRAATVYDTTNKNLLLYNPISSVWETPQMENTDSEKICIGNANSAVYTYTVPTGCVITSITAKCWGGGGSAGNNTGRNGGAGGYATRTITNTSTATAVYIVVGKAGSTTLSNVGTYFIGKATANASAFSGGGGGGGTAVCWWDGTTMNLICMGGGGGGGGTSAATIGGGTARAASTGNGASGSAGVGGAKSTFTGTPADSTAGSNCSLTATGGGNPLTALTNLGGNGGNAGQNTTTFSSGGGGGGYGGGGGSCPDASFVSAGGGAGDNYGTTTTAAANNTAVNTSDTDYFTSAGTGGVWSGSRTAQTDGCATVYLTYRRTAGLYRVLVLTLRALTMTANTATALSFNSFTDSQYSTGGYKFYDPLGFHSNSTNLTRFTVPTGGSGVYKVFFQLRPASGVFTNNRIAIRKNGTQVAEYIGGSETTSSCSAMCSVVVDMNATDYLEFWVVETTTTTVAITLMIERI